MPRILIIDDSEELVSLFEKVLKDAGYDVLSCCSSRQGVALLRQEAADLVILDIYMPDLDGLAILRLARQERLKARFLVISGHASPQNMFPLARCLGAVFTLQKPMTPGQLLDSVEAALDGANGSLIVKRRHFGV